MTSKSVESLISDTIEQVEEAMAGPGYIPGGLDFLLMLRSHIGTARDIDRLQNELNQLAMSHGERG